MSPSLGTFSQSFATTNMVPLTQTTLSNIVNPVTFVSVPWTCTTEPGKVIESMNGHSPFAH